MYYFIYPSKDTYIYELDSNSEKNFGGDDVLVLKKEFDGKSGLKGVSRVFLHFDLTTYSQSIIDGTIPSSNIGSLRLYEKKSSELSPEYTLVASSLSSSWEQGSGLLTEDPNKRNGVSWERTDETYDDTKWVQNTNSQSGSRDVKGGGVWYTGSNYNNTQDFSYESPDVNLLVSGIVDRWLGGSMKIPNNGVVLRWSGSYENSTTTTGDIQFHSYDANNIYSPKIELKWDEHTAASGSNTGSLSALDIGQFGVGAPDVYLYMTNLRSEYNENEVPKFRVGARNRYQTKSTSTTYTKNTQKYVPEKSGSYSIIDVTTGETIIPFDEYTYLSCDSKGSFFKLNLKTLLNNRLYRIKLKLQTNDNLYNNRTLIFDDGFDFKVTK